nr:aldehyde dehydrogenase family 2 member C4 [Ipomoea batatas]
MFSEGKNADVPSTAGYFRYYAGAADKIHGTTLKMSNDLQAYTLCEPIGVVGLIIPWNYPAQIFGFKVAAALAAGCTVIVKPAEQTPLSALYYAHLAKLAGVPDGVLNVITGFGSIVGAAISSHMDIDKVSFTGSTEVGRQIMQAAATSNLKPVSLELGGKCPFIVFDDVDVDKVSDLGLVGATYNKEGIYEKFVEKVVAKAKAKASKKQYEKILSYIEQGKREGATLLTGGKPLDRKGYFIHPTIFTDVTDDMLIAKDEIFGPVMPILKFK